MRSGSTLLALLLLLGAALTPVQARAEYCMEFANLLVTDGESSAIVSDGAVIDRFATRFLFSFYDQLDPATVAPNVAITGPDGSTLNWRLETATTWFDLYPPGPLEPNAPYTLHVRGGPDGIRNADGASMQGDLLFHLNTDDPPFALSSITLIDGDQAGQQVADGDILPRNTGAIVVRFTHPLLPASLPHGFGVAREDGADAGWTAELRGKSIHLTWPERLPRADQRYNIIIQGGETGLKNILGEPFAETITTALHTLDRAYLFHATLQSNWQQYGVRQHDLFRFSADAGTLTIRHFWAGTPTVLRILLIDEDRQSVLMDRYVLVRGEAFLTPTLPQLGRYSLLLIGNQTGTLTISGNDLSFPTVTPALTPLPLSPFDVRNEPFQLDQALFNPEETERVTLYLNDLVLSDTPVQPDGTVPAFTVHPSPLTDGVYYLALIGKAQHSQNLGFHETPFLVDRVLSFPDVPDAHWAHRYVEAMHDLGVINGRGNGLYDPTAPVTRAEFAKLLAVTLGLEANPGAPNPFADTAGHWAEAYIQALWEHGLATGDLVDGQRYYYPERNVSRAEAATLLGRALGVSAFPVEERPFTDWDEVPGWAQPSVATLARLGWLNGLPGGSYNPAGQLQRDQAAKLLSYLFVL